MKYLLAPRFSPLDAIVIASIGPVIVFSGIVAGLIFTTASAIVVSWLQRKHLK